MSEETNEDNWLYGLDKSESKIVKDKEKIHLGKSDETKEDKNFESLDDEKSKNSENILKEHICIEEDPAIEMEEQENSQFDLQGDTCTINNSNGKRSKESDEEYSEDESEDDDINIVIGRIKTGPIYPKQRSNFLAPSVLSQAEKKQISGKFSIEEFESLGSINGISIQEFSLDSLDEKPWRKPGADITDYFNYGFNEDTWRAYCEKQKRVRVNESGVGLQALTAAVNGISGQQTNAFNSQLGQTPQVISSNCFTSNNRTLTQIMNTEKYSGVLRNRSQFIGNQQIPRENSIQVMTAECRDYSKLNFVISNDDSFFENETYNYGFEPTQDLQWMGEVNKNWQPTGIKELTLDPGTEVSKSNISQAFCEGNSTKIETFVPQIPTSLSGFTRPKENMLPPKNSMLISKEWTKDRDREKDSIDKEREVRVREKEKSREKRDRDTIFERDRHDRDNRERDRQILRKRSREKSRERNNSKPEEIERNADESREKRRRDRLKEREQTKERSYRRDDFKSKEKSKSYDKNQERKEKRDKKRVKEKNGSE